MKSKLGWKTEKGWSSFLICYRITQLQAEQVQFQSREWNKHHPTERKITNLFHCSTISLFGVPCFPNCCLPYAIPDCSRHWIWHAHVHSTFPLLNRSKFTTSNNIQHEMYKTCRCTHMCSILFAKSLKPYYKCVPVLVCYIKPNWPIQNYKILITEYIELYIIKLDGCHKKRGMEWKF